MTRHQDTFTPLEIWFDLFLGLAYALIFDFDLSDLSLRIFVDTVYRENFAPVLFSPSDLRANLKLG